MGLLERAVELKSNAKDYFNVWRMQAHKLPGISSSVIQGLNLEEGDWASHGAVKTWSYTVSGKAETFKEKVEYDDSNLSFTLNGSEGHVFDCYKLFKPSCKLIPKEVGCTAKLMIEYQKVSGRVPDPTAYMDLFETLTKDIDAHVAGAPAANE